MAPSSGRPRKRAAPSFDVPADVTSPADSGWVFRSGSAAPAPAAPSAPAPVIASGGPLRFAWLPIAVGVSTILAMLPRTHTRDEDGRS